MGKAARVDNALISSVMVYCLRSAVPTPQSEIVHISIIGERQTGWKNHISIIGRGGRRRTAPNFSLTSAKLSVGSTCRKIVCDLRLTRTYCEQVLEDIEGSRMLRRGFIT